MANPNTYDPTQKPSLHNNIGTFDDPIRKVGSAATASFDNSKSDPTEWAGREALGIDDADLADIQVDLEDEEDEADEEDLDVDDEDEEVEDEDDHLIHVNGTRTKH
jgi:hypothetical protein